MKINKLFIFIVFLFSFSKMDAFEYEPLTYINIYDNYNNLNQSTLVQNQDFDMNTLNTKAMSSYEESFLRRGEIIFLISYPLVLVSHFIIISSLYYIDTLDYKLRIPSEIVNFAVISSLFISVQITYSDYTYTKNLYKENKENKKKELVFGIKRSFLF